MNLNVTWPIGEVYYILMDRYPNEYMTLTYSNDCRWPSVSHSIVEYPRLGH